MTTVAYHARRNDLALLWHQVRYEQLSFWRNPQNAIFTFAFPVVFIVILGALLGHGSGSSYFYGLSTLQYYVPTIAVRTAVAVPCSAQPAARYHHPGKTGHAGQGAGEVGPWAQRERQ